MMTSKMENMRQKYFLDVLTQPQSQKNDRNSKSVGASKHPKNTFDACFRKSRHMRERRDENFVPSALVARMILIMSSKNSSDSVTKAMLITKRIQFKITYMCLMVPSG